MKITGKEYDKLVFVDSLNSKKVVFQYEIVEEENNPIDLRNMW